ncbi:hypothetical protein J4232_01305 [Candidatus Woesearchaeota archaeon]|nr:hypothetical protein [Candidatus Woesearchaeota archaeon]
MEKGNTSKYLIFIVLIIVLISVLSKVIVAEQGDEPPEEIEDDSVEGDEKSDKISPQESDIILTDQNYNEGELDPNKQPSSSGATESYEGDTKLRLEVGIICFNPDYYGLQSDKDKDIKKSYVGKPFVIRKTYADKEGYDGKINEFLKTDFSSNPPSINIPFDKSGVFNSEPYRELFISYEAKKNDNYDNTISEAKRNDGHCRYYIRNDQEWYKKNEGKKPDEQIPRVFSLSGRSGEATQTTVESQSNPEITYTKEVKTYQKEYLGTAVMFGEETGFMYQVDWDGNSNQCIGTYMDNQKIGSITNFNNNAKVACCGDDYIWLTNKVINYNENKQKISLNHPEETEIVDYSNQEKLCLYPTIVEGVDNKEYGEPIQIIDSETGAYRCTSNPYPRKDYDKGNFGTKNKVKLRGLGTTDLGLYKLGEKKVPLYCNHYFDQGKGDVFEWITLDEAAKITSSTSDIDFTIESEDTAVLRQNPEYVKEDLKSPEEENKFDPYLHNVCNFYLSGRWTGSRCCMQEFNYETKERKEITYNEENPTHDSIDGNLLKIPNGACVKSTYIDYAKPFNDPIDDNSKQGYYAVKGKIWTCNALQTATITPIIPSAFHFITSNDALEPQEEPLFSLERNYNTCQAKRIAIDNTNKYISACLPDNTFLVFNEDNIKETDTLSDEEKEALKTAVKLGYPAEELILTDSKAKNLELEEIPMKLSTVPWVDKDSYDYSSCCFANSCWNPAEDEDGPNCVSEGEAVSSETTGDGKFYICKGGEWKEPTPKYNWYNDTIELETLKQDGSNLCTESFSCACPSAAYDDEDQCDQKYTTIKEGSLNLEEYAEDLELKSGGISLCTNKEFFFHKDHLCEPVYKNNQLVNAEWSSRTKVLAIQLLDIAGDNEFTLHCAPADQTLNYNSISAETEAANILIKDAVNSFCILKVKDQTYLGVTVNKVESENTEQDSITFDPTELFNTLGFVKSGDFFDEDAAKCDIKEEDSSRYGIYKKCSEHLYYNNKLKAIIYNKNGINNLKDIQENYNKHNSQLKGFANTLIGLHSSQKELDAFKSKSFQGSDIIAEIADFNNFYLLKNIAANQLIFGITERKWDPSSGETGSHSLRYFTAIIYFNPIIGIFNQNIDCTKIAQADQDIYCNMIPISTSSLTYLFTKTEDENGIPYNKFSDLTSKLRIRQQLQAIPINPALVPAIEPIISPQLAAILSSNQMELPVNG